MFAHHVLDILSTWLYCADVLHGDDTWCSARMSWFLHLLHDAEKKGRVTIQNERGLYSCLFCLKDDQHIYIFNEFTESCVDKSRLQNQNTWKVFDHFKECSEVCSECFVSV